MNSLDQASREVLQALLAGLWQGLVLTLLAWCLLRLFPRLSAASRYAIWFVTLLGVAALPLIPRRVAAVEPRMVTEVSVVAAPSPQPLPEVRAGQVPRTPIEARTAPAPEPVVASQAAEPVRGSGNLLPLRITLGGESTTVIAVWGVLALLGLLRVAWSLARLWRIKRTSEPAPPELAARVKRWLPLCDTARPVRLAVSTRVSAPLLAGFRNPLIVLPASLADHLTTDEIDQIGLHELAHLRRFDDWTNLAQKLIQAVLFYHPCVHWIGRRLNLDREIACDDWVLAASDRRKSYAECLMRLFDLKGRRGPALAPGAVQGRSHIARRIETLLDRKRNAAPRVSLAALVFSLGLVGLVLLQATAAPPVTVVEEAVEPETASAESERRSHEAEERRQAMRRRAQERREAASARLREHEAALRHAAEQQLHEQTTRLQLEARRPQERMAESELVAQVREQSREQAQASEEERRRIAAEARREAEEERRRVAEEQNRLLEERKRQAEEARRLASEQRREEEEQRREEQEQYRRERDDQQRWGETRRWSQSSGFWQKFSVEARGQFEFAENDRDVRSISPDGFLRMEERRGWNTRKLEFTRGPDGSVVRSYWVGSEQRPMEEARPWMNEILPEMIREMAIGADARVKRIFKQRGAIGVLDEIGRIHSDGATRVYFEEFFANGPHDAANLRQAMRQISRQISSDGEKRRVLEHVADSYLGDESLRFGYFDAVDGISSDGERRRVLSTVLAKSPGRDAVNQVARSAARISSDGEKARVLTALVETTSLDAGSRTAFFKAVGTISSSGEQRRVLTAALRKSGQSPEVATQAIRAAAQISSDGEKAAVLAEAAVIAPNDPVVQAAIVQTAGSISSDGEKRRALSGVLARKDLPKTVLVEAAKVIATISSDGEKARVLTELAAHKFDAETRARFFEAADTISSDGERRRVLSSVVRREPADKDLLLGVLKSARGIASDGEKGRLLVEVAAVCPADDALIGAYLETVRGISSDGEYRRAVSALSSRQDLRGKVRVIL